MSAQTTYDAVTPELAARWGVRMTLAGPSLWRVRDAGGRVIGHLQSIPHAEGPRFRARRFHAPSRTLRDLGDFWNADDALECLRLSR